MKKLMIAAAVICIAVISQAASLKWSTTGIQTDNTLSGKAAGYTALAFIQSADAGSAAATLAKVWALDSAVAALTKDGGADLTNFKVDGGKAVSTVSTKAGAANVPEFSDANWSDATSAVQSYVIVFNNADVSKATQFLVLEDGTGNNILSSTFADAADTVTAKFGSQSTNAGWTNIASVPEPTSGLLLLLGVAGMALRRRRA